MTISNLKHIFDNPFHGHNLMGIHPIVVRFVIGALNHWGYERGEFVKEWARDEHR